MSEEFPAPAPRKRRTNAPRPLETAAAVKRPEALRLRMAGLPFSQIARWLDVDKKTARNYVQAELRASAATPAEVASLRQIETLRLEALLVKWQAVALGVDGEQFVSPSGLDPNRPGEIATGKPEVPTMDDRRKAAELCVRISARLSALWGLDGPMKLDASVRPGLTPETMKKLEEKLFGM